MICHRSETWDWNTYIELLSYLFDILFISPSFKCVCVCDSVFFFVLIHFLFFYDKSLEKKSH